jgi:uncharacterized protein (DUF427 family)
MTLTLGPGPLGTQPGGRFNFALDGAPAHRLYLDPFPRRVRALIGGAVVLDSVHGALLHESNHLPVLYVPLEDLRGLEPSDHTTHCPFKGDASYFHLDGVENAVWTYEEPIDAAAWLRGLASLYHDKADAWFVEDERVFYKLRDPFHRVDVFESSRPVTVTANGEVIARSERAKLLFETGVPALAYIPGADVEAGALTPGEKRTRCPYKGEASYWHVRGIADGAWSYEAPLPEAAGVARHVSFRGDGIEVTIGEPADRFTLG